MPLIETKGAASAQGFGEFAASSSAVNYIENVFSTYLYAGAGATQTITNGIDLAGQGGLVWIKNRTLSANWHVLTDTARGTQKEIYTNSAAAQATLTTSGINQFNANGFQIVGNTNDYNGNTSNYVSWTFRKQPKFFDVVTYTGSSISKTINHSLGSTPAFIITKRTNDTQSWYCYHTSLGVNGFITLDSSATSASQSGMWGVSSTTFTVGGDGKNNGSGANFVAYLFASNAGGFGLTGTDDVISCGSYTGNGTTSGATINLGFEPQWLLVKRTSGGVGDWIMFDSMRGLPVSADGPRLFANLSDTEGARNYFAVSATGFRVVSTDSAVNNDTNTYIYVAIRRGPMKVPTSGTSVFQIATSVAANTVLTSNFPIDTIMGIARDAGRERNFVDRLRSMSSNTTNFSATLVSQSQSAEGYYTTLIRSANNTSASTGTYWGSNSYVSYLWSRAPKFFDVVCYTGTGSAVAQAHKLGVAPEMLICKSRNSGSFTSDNNPNWGVYFSSIGTSVTQGMFLNATNQVASSPCPITSADATTFTPRANTSSASWSVGNVTYIAYLFATLAGVSKVGSYTGTGSTQTINCGFTGGARFVMIKRTNAIGDWVFWDTVRGMVAGNDRRSAFNNSDAESNANWVYTATTGFEIVTSEANVNASGGNYVFLAIA